MRTVVPASLVWDEPPLLAGGRLVEFWSRATVADPSRQRHLAAALGADGRWTEAEAAWRALPNSRERRQGLGLSLLGQDRFAEAVEQFRDVSVAVDGPALALEAAGCRLRAGDAAGAEALQDEVLAAHLSPLLRARALGERALLRQQAGLVDEACAIADQALELAPWNATLLTLRFQLTWMTRGAAAVTDRVHPDRLIRSTQLPVAPEFHAALLEQLRGSVGLFAVDGDPVTRSSRRINDALPAAAGPLGELTDLLRRACDDFMPHLAAAHPHPGAAGWLPLRVRLNGWCLMMREEGAVDAHLHPRGVLSGAYYVQVPRPSDSDDPAGCLEFGSPEAPATFRRIRPKAGMLVLFPSFYTHRSVPNRSAQERVVIAFDVIPA